MTYLINIKVDNYRQARDWCSENIMADREWSSRNPDLSPKTPWGWDWIIQPGAEWSGNRSVVFLFHRKTDAIRFKLMGF